MATNSIVGQVIPWASTIASSSGFQEIVSGWLLCNGVAVAKGSFPDLWDLFSQGGTQPSPWDYGAPQTSTFLLPLINNMMVLGTSGSFSLGSKGGADTVALDSTTIPGHTHNATLNSAGSHNHGTVTTTTESAGHVHTSYFLNHKTWPSGTTGAIRHFVRHVTNTNQIVNYEWIGTTTLDSASHTHSYTSSTAGDHFHSGSSDSSGSSTAHNNLPPYLTISYLIKY